MRIVTGSKSGLARHSLAVAAGVLAFSLVQGAMAQGGGGQGGGQGGGGMMKREHVTSEEELHVREKQRAKDAQQQNKEHQQVQQQSRNQQGQGGGQGQGQGQQTRNQAGDHIYGDHLMSEQERNQHRERVKNAKSDQEREQIRNEHRNMIRDRATKQGVPVPEGE